MSDDRFQRIVRIEARFEDAEPKRGTGFRVGPGQILTAQHLVECGHREGRIRKAKEIEVLLDQNGSGEILRRGARTVWRGEEKLDPDAHKALDAALIEDDLPGDDLEPFHRWVGVSLGESGRWETEGFATAAPDVDEMGSEYLWGKCHPAREQATHLKLSVERQAPVSWAGISGAPVFVKDGRHAGCLYGVIRSSPEAFTDELYAVGTPALLRQHELRRLLGIQDPVPPHASLVERMRGLLDRDRDLARILASYDPRWKEGWSAGIDELVDVLCAGGSLKSALEHLRRLRSEMDSAGSERARELAVVLVSILASQELPDGTDLTAASVDRILRPGTASPNFAEALLASAYGTPCLYERCEGTDPDLPRAVLRVQEPVLEAGIQWQSQVDDHLEELLWDLLEKNMNHPKWIMKAQKALFGHLPPGEQREALKEQLKENLAQLKADYGRPAYLVATGELQKRMGKPSLEVFLDRLGKALPDLDFVVLETEKDEVIRAIQQEGALRPLWKILDLFPERSP